MTVKEVKEVIKSLRKSGASDEDIAGSFYMMFVNDKIDVNQLNALLNVLGYHLSDEFLSLSTEEQKEYISKK